MTEIDIRSLPKVDLHDHLDGGLRPATLLELGDGVIALPATDVPGIVDWMHQGTAGSLERYLEAFHFTVAVMQTQAAIERIAYESAADLAGDRVAYAEIRFAPMLATRQGLSIAQVLEATQAGLSAARRDYGIETGIIVDAMRQDDDSLRVVEESAGLPGVVGFDLAGPERGYPPELHLAACRRALKEGLGLTIHAGEDDGPDSVRRAIELCGAQRIGHGVRIIEDCEVEEGTIVAMGPVATAVHGGRIPLEVCPTSNLHTMQITARQHPVGLLHRAGFVVTISPDNRLMSSTDVSTEFELLVAYQDFAVDDLAKVTHYGINAGFGPEGSLQALWAERLAPAYRAAGASI
ncbi:MAG: adenosine deaminase [Acidimicrobiia bacterium]|nr:adenosine deaminase [Acidimicrobiia bacterium]